jgi:hypothetical protein
LSQEVIDRLLSLLQGGLEIASVETLIALGATEICIHFNLSEGLREFMAALRTSDRNLKGI